MTAPDATAGDGLREAIARTVFAMDRHGPNVNRAWSELYGRQRRPYLRTADAVLALPALRDVLAAAARDAEKVRKPGTVALAWHDVVCPEGEDCRDRPLHAASQTIVNGGIVDRFLDRLAALDGGTP